jgi:methanogenic corrinoid protein MtbC1
LKVLLDADQHTGESVLVVIGAAHMVGRRSVGAILDAQGYEVHRVSRSELRRTPTPGEAVAVHP